MNLWTTIDTSNEMNYSDRTLNLEDDWVLRICFKNAAWEQEIMDIEDYLWLNWAERVITNTYKINGFILVWERDTWDDYPDYLKYFFINNNSFFIDWEERTIERFSSKDIEWRELKQLIFVRLRLPRKVNPQVNEESIKAREAVTWILNLI